MTGMGEGALGHSSGPLRRGAVREWDWVYPPGDGASGGSRMSAQAEPERTERDIQRLVAALGDPTRRRAFFAVREAGAPQTKDEVAAALGIDRRLAGLPPRQARRAGLPDRRLPPPRAAARARAPAARPSSTRWPTPSSAVALPERHYDLLASLLLRAMARAGAGDPQEALERVGYDFGRELGAAERGRRPRRPPGPR